MKAKKNRAMARASNSSRQISRVRSVLPESTTTISLDGLQFTRLCGGRPMTPNRPQAIDYDGDVAVGERIVANLAYVI